jgi:hypothetical protein
LRALVSCFVLRRFCGFVSFVDCCVCICVSMCAHDSHANGDCYDGDWADDLPHGFGTLKFKDGPAEYAGAFVHGHRTGKGVFVFGRAPSASAVAAAAKKKNNSNDIKQKQNNKPAGAVAALGATATTAVTPSPTRPSWFRYDGSFLSGVFEGHGKLTLADGRYYEGDFQGGVRHGYGVQILCPDNERGDPARLYIGGASGMCVKNALGMHYSNCCCLVRLASDCTTTTTPPQVLLTVNR